MTFSKALDLMKNGYTVRLDDFVVWLSDAEFLVRYDYDDFDDVRVVQYFYNKELLSEDWKPAAI